MEILQEFLEVPQQPATSPPAGKLGDWETGGLVTGKLGDWVIG